MSKIHHLEWSQKGLQLHRALASYFHRHQPLCERIVSRRAPEIKVHLPANPKPRYGQSRSLSAFLQHDFSPFQPLATIYHLHFFVCVAVKPETTEMLHLQAVSDMQLELHWDGPIGRVPAHCLEWEVEHSQEGPDGKVASVIEHFFPIFH